MFSPSGSRPGSRSSARNTIIDDIGSCELDYEGEHLHTSLSRATSLSPTRSSSPSPAHSLSGSRPGIEAKTVTLTQYEHVHYYAEVIIIQLEYSSKYTSF